MHKNHPWFEMKIGCVDKQKCANKSSWFYHQVPNIKVKKKNISNIKLEFNKEKKNSGFICPNRLSRVPKPDKPRCKGRIFRTIKLEFNKEKENWGFICPNRLSRFSYAPYGKTALSSETQLSTTRLRPISGHQKFEDCVWKIFPTRIRSPRLYKIEDHNWLRDPNR